MASYRLKSDVVFRKEDDGALLYNHVTGNIHTLNETASDLCELLFIQNKSKEDTFHEMKKLWQTDDLEELRLDMDEFINDMEKNGFIQL